MLGPVDRRAVIDEYIRYHSSKKGEPRPDTSNWDWTMADTIDSALRAANFKHGIPAGFTEWVRVSLTVDDLRECAVVDTISSELASGARDLGTLEADGRLVAWRPRSPAPAWLKSLELGTPLSAEEPFLLRPTVLSEAPAKWYLEDGSGRATTIVANAGRFDSELPVAYGFLGTVADASSTFMLSRFSELLRNREAT
jgi:hypothetical protein